MLHKNITRLRKLKGLTQVEFAKLIHVTQSAVSHWESGRSVPDTLQLFRIAEFFGVTIEELNADPVKPEAKQPLSAAKQEPKETAPADMRAEAKQILEGLSPKKYQEALNFLKYLESQN